MKAETLFRVIAGLLTAHLASGATASQLQLTPDGVADGFSLSTFVQLRPDLPFDFSNLQPYGLATLGSGSVLVNDVRTATRYVFADVDGQTPATATFARPTLPTPAGYTYSNGVTYGGDGSGVFVKFNTDGTVNSTIAPGAAPVLGMAAAPNGHLFATSSQGLIDIDPAANSFKVLNAGLSTGDGVSVALDGKTIYVASDLTDNVLGYDSTTGRVVFDSGLLGHGPDGTAVIDSSGPLNGKIVINNNDGTVAILDPANVALGEVIIASGGSRGDYVAPDARNGTLLLDQSESVMRLSCGAACSIGSPVSPAPEAGTWALMLVGLGAIGVIRRRPGGIGLDKRPI